LRVVWITSVGLCPTGQPGAAVPTWFVPTANECTTTMQSAHADRIFAQGTTLCIVPEKQVPRRDLAARAAADGSE